MSGFFSDRPRSIYASASEAVLGVIDEIAETGVEVSGTKGSAHKARNDFSECLGHSFVLTNPRDRMYLTDRRRLNLSVAVARFIWMMSGSNRLHDIAFYEPKVKIFTDDDYSVPGSSYGQRIFQSSPGIDQLRSVIERVKSDPNTRRATVSIYQPTDATRESADIPCTFGLMYHPRQNTLNAMTIMRSNNAAGLLEFNIFEFSLLAEVVAAEADLELGQLLHFAGSMHAFSDALDGWRESEQQVPTNGNEMREMPRDGNALDQVKKLIVFEAEMRHESAALRGAKALPWISRAQTELEPYWQQLAFILLLTVARRNQDVPFWEELRSLLWKEYEPFYRELTVAGSGGSSTDLVTQPADLLTYAERAPIIVPEFAPDPDLEAEILDFSDALAKKGRALTLREYSAVQRHLLSRVAARLGSEVKHITQDMFDDALRAIDSPKRPK